ncbi:MAG: M48 family metalloprotease [Candidatus Binatia bacterium]
MSGRAALAALLFAVGACAPPGAYPPPGGGGIGASELEREHFRLRKLAEKKHEEYQRRVERVARRLLQRLPGDPQIQFVIVSDPQINAGATFGQVAVTTGLLEFARTDDELAMVLGHELAHVTEGHVTKGMLGSLALSILAIVVETQAPGLGNTAGGVGQLFLNRYTQGQERVADTVGIRYAYESGYDPTAAADVQERLAVQVPQTMTAGFFDTHPSSVERMIAARKQAGELLARGSPPGREEVLAAERNDRLRETALDPAADAEEASPPEASASYRPERRRSEASAAEGCRRADTYRRRAEESREASEREELYRRAIRYCPEHAEAHAGLALLLSERGDSDEARRAARRALELDPDNPRAREALERSR